MDLNLSVFQEPRGVMRILHFIFSICAFATITGYTGVIQYNCLGRADSYTFSYPFDFVLENNFTKNVTTCLITVAGVSSSDAQFFVTTGVLAMLYCIAIILVYTKFDDMYKTNTKIPLYDFLITVVFGVLWLSSSAAWANGLTGLKRVTSNAQMVGTCKDCTATSTNFSTLNISVIFGFLNFFLWAADLWFVYKETTWFQGNQPRDTEGV